jgi:hypothetical protein
MLATRECNAPSLSLSRKRGRGRCGTAVVQSQRVATLSPIQAMIKSATARLFLSIIINVAVALLARLREQ